MSKGTASKRTSSRAIVRGNLEPDTQQREAIFEAIHFAATSFLSSSNWDKSIAAVLARLGLAVNADRAYLFENRRAGDGSTYAVQRYEWTRAGISAQINTPHNQHMSYQVDGSDRWANTLSQGGILQGPVHSWPADEQPAMLEESIRSILIVPIFVADQWWGFIGFDDCRSEREWPLPAVDALKTAATILGAALQRQQTEVGLQISNAKFRKFLLNSDDGILLIDEAGSIIEWNERQTEITGIARAEALGLPLWDLLYRISAPEEQARLDAAQMESIIRGFIATGSSPILNRVHERVIVRPDGSRRTIQNLIFPIDTQDGFIAGCIATDLTSHRMAEEALRQGEDRYRAIVEHQLEMVCRFHLDLTLTYVNQSFCQYFEKTPEEMLGQNIFDFISPNQRVQRESMLASQLESPHQISFEIPLILASGELRWQHWNSCPIFDSAGQLVEFQAVGRDITAQKEAEDLILLQRDLGYALGSTAGLQDTLNTLLDMAVCIDSLDSGSVYLSEPDSGDLEIAVYKNLSSEFVQKLARLPSDSRLAKIIQAGQPQYNHLDKALAEDAEVFAAEGLRAVALVPILHDGQVMACLNIASHTQDIISITARAAIETIAAQMGSVIARVQAENALRESQHNLQGLFDSLHDFLFVLSRDGRILQTNPVVQQRLGLLPDPSGRKTIYMVHPENRHLELQQALTLAWSSGMAVVRMPLVDHRGRTISVETVFTPGRWAGLSVLFGVSRDITDRERIEKAEREQRLLVEGLRNSTTALNSTLRFDEVLDRILENVGLVVQHDAATVMFLEDGISRVVRSRGYAELGLAEAILTYRLGMDVARNLRMIVETGRPVVIPDTHASELWTRYPQQDWIRSYAGAPIRVKGQIVGFLNLDSGTPGFFSAEHAERLQAFADQAGVAIGNARLFEETQRRARQLDILSRITQDALKAFSLKEMFDILANRLIELFESDNVYICLWDYEHDVPYTVAVSGAASAEVLALPLNPGETSLTGAALQAGHALIIHNEPREETHLSPRLQPLMAEHTLLALPLITAERKLGAAIIGFREHRTFSPAELALGEQAAAQISLAVAKNQALEAERQRTAQLGRANAFITALDRVSARVGRAPDPQGVVETLGAELEKLGIHCLVTSNDDETGGLVLQYASMLDNLQTLVSGFAPIQVSGYQFPPSAVEIFHLLIRQQKGTFTLNLVQLTDQILPPELLPFKKFILQIAQIDEETRCISLPLMVEERVVGLLSLWGHSIHEADLPAAVVFASQVAIASENARLYAEVQRLAITDDLTGQLNRRGLFDLCQRELERSLRFEHPLCMIMLDGDLFKDVNDTYGHLIGDQVIRELAARLHAHIRDVDILGRYGNGDEFAVLLVETKMQNALEAAERLRSAVGGEPMHTTAGPVSVTISLGVAELSGEVKSLEELFGRADRALYLAKAAGRNCVAAYQPAGETA